MRAPKCCKQKMSRCTKETSYGSNDDFRYGRRCYRVWRCDSCGRERELYPKPWRWLWVGVDRNDIMDEVFAKAWWLGSIGSLRGFCQETITFTVIPLNVVVDLVTRVYHWCRYRKPSALQRELERRYREGHVDGRTAQKFKTESVVKKITAKMQKESDPEVRDWASEIDDEMNESCYVGICRRGS